MIRAKVHEIFSSIQGEGPYAGVPQVFVRFFGCNIHCSWCDTPAAIGDAAQSFDEYSVGQILEEIERLWDRHHSVSLTGGEPLLQADAITELLPRLSARGMNVFLETGGTLPAELEKVIDGIGIVSMDLKLPSSTGERPFWEEHAAFLRIAARREHYLKAVISGSTREEDIARMIDLVAGVDPQTRLILQPNSFEMHNGVVEKCRDFQALSLARLPNTRVLPQMHRFMKVR